LIEISPYTKSSIRITGKRLNFSGSLSKSVQPSIIPVKYDHSYDFRRKGAFNGASYSSSNNDNNKTKAKQEQEEGEEEKESAEKSEGKVNPNLDILTLLVDKRVQRRS